MKCKENPFVGKARICTFQDFDDISNKMEELGIVSLKLSFKLE